MCAHTLGLSFLCMRCDDDDDVYVYAHMLSARRSCHARTVTGQKKTRSKRANNTKTKKKFTATIVLGLDVIRCWSWWEPAPATGHANTPMESMHPLCLPQVRASYVRSVFHYFRPRAPYALVINTITDFIPMANKGGTDTHNMYYKNKYVHCHAFYRVFNTHARWQAASELIYYRCCCVTQLRNWSMIDVVVSRLQWYQHTIVDVYAQTVRIQ